MGDWERVAKLELSVEGYSLEGLQLETASGWTRHSTEVHLVGAGGVGRGEDVIYDGAEQERFQERGAHLDLTGRFTLGDFSARLAALELAPDPLAQVAYEDYRRWAFESAALDLALQQNELTLPAALGREPRALSFVVSTGLTDFSPIAERLALHRELRFKLDAVPDWDTELCAKLAATRAVDVVDFKGAYKGTVVDTPVDLALYERVLDAFGPEVLVEDPHDVPEVIELLRTRGARVSWDAPIHSPSDLGAMPLAPSALNVKPSRVGTLRHLLELYELCEARGLPMYGGGQFELGVGRVQIQELAALFHPDGPNDVAPRGYHQLASDEPRPPSPLALSLDEPGFGHGATREPEGPAEPNFGESMALFQRFRGQGDTRALNELFERYKDRLSRKVSILMSARVRARFEASDIAQSVLMRGYENIDRFEFSEPSSLMRWLTTIALNNIRSKGRTLTTRGEAELEGLVELDLVDLDGPDLHADRPLDQLAKRELRDITDQAITTLREDFRTVILLRSYDGARWREVGAAMDRSAEAAQQLHRRALAALGQELKRRGVR